MKTKFTALLLTLAVLLTSFASVSPLAAHAAALAAPNTITVRVVASYSGTACVFQCSGLTAGTATMWAGGNVITGYFNTPGYIARDLVIYFYNVPIDNVRYCTGNIAANAFRPGNDWGGTSKVALHGDWKGCVAKPWYTFNQDIFIPLTDQ